MIGKGQIGALFNITKARDANSFSGLPLINHVCNILSSLDWISSTVSAPSFLIRARHGLDLESRYRREGGSHCGTGSVGDRNSVDLLADGGY